MSYFNDSKSHKKSNTLYTSNTIDTSFAKNYLPSSIVRTTEETTQKLEMLDRLVGNSREGKELRIQYLKMIITPGEVPQRKLKERPYVAKIMKPATYYEE